MSLTKKAEKGDNLGRLNNGSRAGTLYRERKQSAGMGVIRGKYS